MIILESEFRIYFSVGMRVREMKMHRRSIVKNRGLYCELYDYLEGFDQIDEKEIYEQILDEWSENQVEEFVASVFKLIPNEYFQDASYYNFYANSTLGGAPYPCADLDCRLKNLDDLLRFSALYADKMLMQSPFDKHYENLEAGNRINRLDLVGDIIIILYLKSFVLAGIIGFFSSYVCLCEDCLKKIVSKEDELRNKMKVISDLMYKETSENIRCKLLRDSNDIAYLAIKGAEKLGFHEQVDILIFQENKQIKKLLKKEKEIVVTPKMLMQWGIVNYLFEPLINDVFQAQINTTFLDSSYITNRPYDAMMISEIQKQSLSQEGIEKAKMVETGLFHKVPLIGEVELNKIIKLRQSDGMAFKGYRSKMNSILSEYDKLDRKRMSEIQKDVIRPELDAMEQTLCKNKKSLIQSTAQDLVLVGGSIGIGIFTGLLPVDYSAVVGMIGGISSISNILDKAKKSFTKEEIKSNSFYFLYELQDKYRKL